MLSRLARTGKSALGATRHASPRAVKEGPAKFDTNWRRARRRAAQRRFSHSAGCDPEPFSGNELGLASREANVPRRWGRLLSCWRGLPQDPHHHRDGPMAASCSPHQRERRPRRARQTQRAESLSGSIRQFLTPEVWKQARQAASAAGCRHHLRWTLQPLTRIWAMMTWCAAPTDAERFVTARTFYVAVHCPKRKRPGKHFVGFYEAVQRLPLTVWWAVEAAVRRQLYRILADRMLVDGWTPFGCDGTRLECPRPRHWRRIWGRRANAAAPCSGSRRWSASAPACSGPGGWDGQGERTPAPARPPGGPAAGGAGVDPAGL